MLPYIIISAISTFSLTLTIVLLCIHYIEKIQKVSICLWSLLRHIFIFADKQYTKNDLQGRVNDFVKRLDSKMYGFVPVKMNVKFFTAEDPKGFESNGKYYIRIKRDINPNINFVNVVMFFLSKYLLLKAKKQIPSNQQESIDLFVAKKLFEEEKESVMGEFVDAFLQPKTGDDKIRELFNKHTNSDKAGLFFPVFLQEMVFLGERVFSHPRSFKIKEEVKSLINFLDEYSRRKLGEEDIPTEFTGQFSKFALMIVGKRTKINRESKEPYVKYVKHLMTGKMESIYLIGDIRHQFFITDIGDHIKTDCKTYEVYKKETYEATIKKTEDEEMKVKNFLLALKKKNPDPFIQN